MQDGPRIQVILHDNVCLIRSGQDWGDTETSERKMYLEDVEPVLREGMDFLRDQGRAIGCYANRYMRVVAPDGTLTDKSYGHELVEKPGRAGAMGRVASDPCQDLRRRYEISVDTGSGREAAALSRGFGRPGG